jgi:hypothetical protein
MAFENFPTTEGATTPPPAPKNNWRTATTIGLLVALLGTWGYIIWDKNKVKETLQQKDMQYAKVSADQEDLQKQLNDAIFQYDQLKTENVKKDSVITAKDREISDKKTRIQSLINKANASAPELAEARRLIASLNSDIASYKTQIEELQAQNSQLTQEKEYVTQERDQARRDYDSSKVVISKREEDIKEKEKVIDIGSTLRASNFDINGINERRGGKTNITSKAKKADMLRITFDLDENRIAPSGTKDIYICITDPEGKPVGVEALGSAKFVTREEGEKIYTGKVDVNYTQGQRQSVKFEWKPNSKFSTGDYKIQVYHNGFKIGEGVRSLKKGGFFS